MTYLFTNPFDEDGSRPGKGNLNAKYSLVGISASTRRPKARQYEPFGGGSWRFLHKILNQFPEVSKEDLYITNLVKEPLGPGTKPRVAKIRKWYPHLVEELKAVGSERILALGTVTASVLCPGFSTMREDHGSIFYNPELDAEVIPTYYFSAVYKRPYLFEYLARDFERLFLIERGEMAEIEAVSLSELRSMLTTTEPIIMDIETTGLDAREEDILMIGIRQNKKNVMVENPTNYEVKEVLKLFEELQVPVIGHNIPFDLYFMFWKAGSSDFDIITKDTMLMAHVAGEVAKSLKHLSTMYTDRPGSRAFGGPEDPGYLAEDLLATEDIYHIFDDKVGNLLITKLLNELAGYTTRMRYDGVWIDVPMLNDLEPKIKNNVLELEQELNQLAGEEINWNSPTQIVDFLLDQGVKLTEKTPTGNYTVKESVMIKLAEDYPIAQKILDLREVTKEHQFYESYQEYVSPEHPYLHPKLKLAGTRTGRLSCADPNLQQVKRTGPIKLIFKSRFEGGKYGLVDLSQAELRIAALLADDEKFARALLADDVHREVASMVYNKPASKITKGERKASKAITFGLLYGGSPKGLAARSGLSVTDVKKVVKNLFDNFPGLEKFIEETKSKAIQQKYVETPFGRIRDLSNVLLAQGEWSAARQAVNTPIQSAASDIGLVIMYYLNKMIYYYKMKSRVIFGVHDSVILDIHPDEVETIIQYTQEAFQILQKTPLAKYRLFKILPIIGELVIGPSWAEVEGTNENFNPDKVILCSSIGERKIIK